MQAGNEEQSVIETEPEALLDDEQEQTTEQPEEQPEPEKNESAKESARKALEKLSSNGDQVPEGQPEIKQPEKQAEPQGKIDPALAPPERLPEGQKQLFQKLPKGLKRETNKLFKSYEAAMTKANQAASETRGLMEAIQPYASEWGMRGLSPAQGVAQLAAAQAKLTNPDKNVRLKSFQLLLKHAGLSAEDLGQKGEAAPAAVNEEINSLRGQVQQLQSMISTQQSASRQGETNAIVQELESVRLEVDQTSGDYRYPELHDENFLQQTVKPLVSAIKGSVPGITWADALKKAYSLATGKPGESLNSNQTRLTAAGNINKTPIRMIPPVSVRGKSVSTFTGSEDDVPAEARGDARATARWVLERLKSGR